jgi:uncharacterized protein
MQNKIREMLKDAMRAKDEIALSVYRAILTSFMNELVGSGKTPQDTLTDEECMNVIRREIKKRDDSINQYNLANRKDLSEPEEKEKEVLMKFMPKQFSDDELNLAVSEFLEKNCPLDSKMMGKYIGLANKEFKDFASGDRVKSAVESFFAKI